MSRSRLAAYQVTIGLVASSILSAGAAHMRNLQASIDRFVRLGYACGDLITNTR